APSLRRGDPRRSRSPVRGAAHDTGGPGESSASRRETTQHPEPPLSRACHGRAWRDIRTPPVTGRPYDVLRSPRGKLTAANFVPTIARHVRSTQHAAPELPCTCEPWRPSLSRVRT